MHDIEPYYKWRELYVAADDENSPLYGSTYNEFQFTKKIYNYFIHPQWDDMGSQTLYLKILFVDYAEQYAIIELIGEWNDCIHNDISILKRKIADKLENQEIYRFIILCDNVLNFHASDDSYYEEWREDVSCEGGWISFVNLQEHVLSEMLQVNLNYYVNLGDNFNDIPWRSYNPKTLLAHIEVRIAKSIKQLH